MMHDSVMYLIDSLVNVVLVNVHKHVHYIHHHQTSKNPPLPGGMRLREPAADLAVCAAIASAVRDVPWPPEMAFLGEVGLAGELRAVPQVCAWRPL